LLENFSLRLMVTSNTNPPELKLGHWALHGGLCPLSSDLVKMHNLTPVVEEVMEFQRGLNVKLITRAQTWKLVFLAPLGPLKQILSKLHNFCRFSNL
jgi:hypothetical protein